MPGYYLIEQKFLKPFHEHGLAPYSNRIGFLDFLREIEANLADLIPYSEYTVTGLEQVLYAASSSQREPIAQFFGKKLRHAAPALERKHLQVQILFSGTLNYGNTLFLEYRRERLPIDHIFGRPLKNPLGGDACCFKASFNLTS